MDDIFIDVHAINNYSRIMCSTSFKEDAAGMKILERMIQRKVNHTYNYINNHHTSIV